MEENRSLFDVIKSENDKTNIIINNILLMLSNRIYIDKNGDKQPLINLNDNNIKDKGEGTYVIIANNGDKYAIKIIFQKITAIGKQSVISEFFREYDSYKKIIVANDYNNKILTYVTSHHTQIFRENALLQDIISNENQPKFELLSPSEMEQVKTEYNITDYTTNKILKSDPVAKYFALKKGDIIRIIRPSPVSGQAIAYRIVI